MTERLFVPVSAGLLLGALTVLFSLVLSDAQIAGFIRNGVGQMPAVGAGWTDEEIDAVLSYIKQWWEPEQLAAQTERSAQNP